MGCFLYIITYCGERRGKERGYIYSCLEEMWCLCLCYMVRCVALVISPLETLEIDLEVC